MLPPVIVRIAESDAEAGLPRRADACPAALAASRACGDPVVVGGRFTYRMTAGGTWRCRTPPEMAAAVRAADAGEWVGPAEFVLGGWERTG